MGVPATPLREDLNVPDRFEGLTSAGSSSLRAIISPVEETLKIIDQRFTDMRAARRGGLMILRGETGAGKSTFLNTAPDRSTHFRRAAPYCDKVTSLRPKVAENSSTTGQGMISGRASRRGTPCSLNVRHCTLMTEQNVRLRPPAG